MTDERKWFPGQQVIRYFKYEAQIRTVEIVTDSYFTLESGHTQYSVLDGTGGTVAAKIVPATPERLAEFGAEAELRWFRGRLYTLCDAAENFIPESDDPPQITTALKEAVEAAITALRGWK